jgi:hypothetical protein
MKTPRNKYYLLNYIFLCCLITLVVNDHYLKFEYGNWFTGKLSDIVGIIMLPLLITWLFPGVKERSIVISAALFIFWKSPFSQGAIDLYNQFAFIQTSRIVDYTDLFVLLLLPIPWFLIKRMDSLHALQINRVNPILILLPTVISLMATTPPHNGIIYPKDRKLVCYGCEFTVHYNQPQIEEMLKKADIVLDSMPPVNFIEHEQEYPPYLQKPNVHFYRINSLVIEKDTLRNIEFAMHTLRNKKTKIYWTGMSLEHISYEEMLGKLPGFYESLVFKVLIGHPWQKY